MKGSHLEMLLKKRNTKNETIRNSRTKEMYERKGMKEKRKRKMPKIDILEGTFFQKHLHLSSPSVCHESCQKSEGWKRIEGSGSDRAETTCQHRELGVGAEHWGKMHF